MKDFTKKILKNGIPVYFYKDKNLKRVVVSYNVNYGSNGYYDEFFYKDEKYTMPPGMAHFLEHTLIEHSKYGHMLHRFLDKNYEFNGETYFELTSFYFIGIKGIKESIKELVNMVDDPVFDQKSIEEVKSAIIEELKKTDDNKYLIGYNINRRNIFSSYSVCPEYGNHIGNVESTRSITLDMVKTCYDAYYNNKNKFLVIAGNIDINEYIDYLNSVYDELDDHENFLKEADYSDNFEVRNIYQEITKPVNTDHLIVTYKFKNDHKEKNMKLDLYLFFFCRLKFSSDTKFVTSLINDKVIVGGIGWNTDFFKDVITLTFGADVLDKDKFLTSLESELSKINLDSKKFFLTKRNMIANDLAKMDYIYRSIRRFPVELNFSEKMYNQETLKKCNIEDAVKFLETLSFDTKTVTLIKKEKVN